MLELYSAGSMDQRYRSLSGRRHIAFTRNEEWSDEKEKAQLNLRWHDTRAAITPLALLNYDIDESSVFESGRIRFDEMVF